MISLRSTLSLYKYDELRAFGDILRVALFNEFFTNMQSEKTNSVNATSARFLLVGVAHIIVQYCFLCPFSGNVFMCHVAYK